MSSILKDKHLFYSYSDVNGDGINTEYLTTYNTSLIFDAYNRTMYAYQGIYGPHYIGSYHGETFNDYENNIATGDYSSAHGNHTVAYNDNEAAFGSYNMSNDNTLFSVGKGTDEENRSNAFEVDVNGNAYVNGTTYTHGNAYVNGSVYTSNVWIGDGDSYRDVSYAISRMVKVFPGSPITSSNGKLYVWAGTAEQLNALEQRYKNVIYIVVNQAPSEELPEYDDEN